MKMEVLRVHRRKSNSSNRRCCCCCCCAPDRELLRWELFSWNVSVFFLRGEFNSPSSNFGNVHPSDVLDMPVDPNEPTYCLCHQVSYGEMIGCDNTDVSRITFLLSLFLLFLGMRLIGHFKYRQCEWLFSSYATSQETVQQKKSYNFHINLHESYDGNATFSQFILIKAFKKTWLTSLSRN